MYPPKKKRGNDSHTGRRFRLIVHSSWSWFFVSYFAQHVLRFGGNCFFVCGGSLRQCALINFLRFLVYFVLSQLAKSDVLQFMNEAHVRPLLRPGAKLTFLVLVQHVRQSLPTPVSEYVCVYTSLRLDLVIPRHAQPCLSLHPTRLKVLYIAHVFRSHASQSHRGRLQK